MSKESSDTIVQHIYDDSYSYLTEDGKLILKQTPYFEERTIAELEAPENEDEVASQIEKYRNAFEALEEKVKNLLEQDDLTEDNIKELEKQLVSAEAIGDYASLMQQLQNAREAMEEIPEEETEESGQQETADITGDGAEEETAAAAEDEAKTEQPESEEEGTRDSEETGVDEQLSFYADIVEKAEELAKQSDWPYVSMELDSLGHEWDEGPEIGEDQKEELGKLYDRYREACEKFEERKKQHYEELKRQKRENLETKKKLLADLEQVVEEKQWSAVQKVNRIRGKWKNIGLTPSGNDEDLDDKFSRLVDTFEDHKVDRLVQKRQKEEDNLTGKLIVLDKMEEVAASIDENTSDWKVIDKEFDRLTGQFKKIGRVPNEKADEVWSRYKSAQDKYYDRKYEFDKKHRKRVDKYHSKKEKLCEEAEALLETSDLASAAKKINRLHRKWKKAGNLPQRDEDKLWARFKAATDEFNEFKSENLDKLREQEEKNYEKKLELIEKAKEIQDTTEWDKGHNQMQSLLNEWKKIGPVPRKKSRQVWKKFKQAQDVFYDRRREHFKEVKEEQKENLEEKKEILEKLRELGRHDDPIEAVNLAKPLQEKFKDAGYVPIKKKNKIWKQYREACDIIYDRFRAAKSGNKFDQELAKADLEPNQRAKLLDMRKKYKKVKKEIRDLEEQVIQFKESKTYFKPTGKGNDLLDEIQKKIDKTEEKIEDKQDLLDKIDRDIESIRENA